MGGFCHTRQVKDPVDTLHRFFQGVLFRTIPEKSLDRKTPQPFQVARFPEEAADPDSFLMERFHKMTSDKARSPSDQHLQIVSPLVNFLNFICFRRIVKDDSTFPMDHPPYQLTDRGRRDELVIFSDESNIGEA
jgi:hypothetical protein